ncbi:MAG: chemotaxis protein CheC [Spirochaetales bacterium]|nr:chemotaxis protein CheC [Spirochaetales bacterium]
MQLSELQLDFLKENFNIGVGRGAKVLNSMLSSHINLSVPEIELVDKLNGSYFPHLSSSIATVDLEFNGSLAGTCKLLFPADSALNLVRQVSGEDEGERETDFDPMSEGVLKEIGNIVLNSVMGVIGNTLDIQLQYTVPTFKECQVEELIDKSYFSDESTALLARICFSIEVMDIRGEILTLFRLGSFSELLSLIDKKIDA